MKVAQIGKETTWGTPVAATRRLPLVSEVRLRQIVEFGDLQLVGNLAPSFAQWVAGAHAEGQITTLLSPNDLFVFRGLFGDVTPTGTTPPYTWTYSAPLTSFPTSYYYTLEAGTTDASYKVAGMILSRASFRVEVGGSWQATVDYMGKQITTVTLASLSAESLTPVHAGNTSIYVDSWTGNMGTTELAASLISAELEIRTGRHMKNFIGSMFPSGIGDSRWEGNLRLQLEFNSSVKSIIDTLLGTTPGEVQRQIEIRVTQGTHSIKFQFCGGLSEAPELWGDRDGNMVVETNWKGLYNSTFGNWLKVIVTNGINTYP